MDGDVRQGRDDGTWATPPVSVHHGVDRLPARRMRLNGSQTILLVEDEAFVAMMLQDVLEAAGFPVITVHSSGLAKSVLESRPGDLAAVITDIRLGGSVDGWELAHYARSQIPDVPIVYLSGGSEHDHRSMGVAHSLLIRKPFTSAQLLAAVRPLLAMTPAR
ncbi:response regulator [Sandarakinorhabdus sp.]|uniref:response regulator n=1 Tax=Sandarakinorhabdus sp. TaxID=1916663 RepID=UPI003341C47B